MPTNDGPAGIVITGKCPAPSASGCGGDLSGKWNIAGVCAQDPAVDCAGAMSATTGKATGSISFDANGSLGTSTDIMYQPKVTLPLPACTCPSQAFLQPCTANGAACDCGASYSAKTSGAGTWSANGNIVTLMGPFNGDYTYCVTGSTLVLYAASENYPSFAVVRLER